MHAGKFITFMNKLYFSTGKSPAIHKKMFKWILSKVKCGYEKDNEDFYGVWAFN